MVGLTTPYINPGIETHMDDLIFNLLPMDNTKIRVTITDKDHNEKGVLYFERVKTGFNRKPISMNSWACVDAKIDGLYDMGGDFTSLDILNRCQDIISSPAGQEIVRSVDTIL
jgi:hypothetical protein